MPNNTELKKALYKFNAEANKLLRARYDDIDVALKRFVTYIESDGRILGYLTDCVDNYLPDGFDAKSEVQEVTRSTARFGPFPPNGEGEAAEVYLILKVMAEEGIGSRTVFYSYGNGSRKYDDMCKGFLDDVARRLINEIETYLTMVGIDAGFDDRIQQTNNFNNVGTANAVLANGGSSVTINQETGFDFDRFEKLIADVHTASEGLDSAGRHEVAELLEGIREAVQSNAPKKSVLRSLLSGLNGISDTAQFVAAVTSLVQFFSGMSI